MSYLLSLSHELLHCVFSELEGSDLSALSRSCRALHSYIRGNRLLHRDVYLRFFDEPSHRDVDWESALHRVCELQKILESDRGVAAKTEHLETVADGIDWLLKTCTLGAIRSHNIMHLRYWFNMNDNVDAFLSNSSLFERVRDETRSSARTPTQHQTSARLHCLFGVPIEHVTHRTDLEAIDSSPIGSPSSRTRSRTRLACPHSYARSKVYDLREYTDKTLWGPFMPDGSHRVDWEKVEAIMIDIGFNLNKITERSSGRLGRIWGEPWEDAAPNSYISPPPIVDPESIDDADVLKLREMALALDAQDPYGISGSWMRVVCFLDYNDLYAFNFSPGLRDDDPREPINTEEAIRLIRIKLQVTRIAPPGSGDDGEDDGLDWSNFTGERLPVVYFCGTSRSMHASWDPNANSRIRGSVRQTPEGEIRWTTFSVFHGEEKWRSEGIQVGGLRSARGVLGNWFDKDFDEHGPAGPTAFWKVTDHFDDEKPFLMPSNFL